jgi:hypothetical protein
MLRLLAITELAKSNENHAMEEFSKGERNSALIFDLGVDFLVSLSPS